MNHLRITNSESFCSIRTKVSKRAHHSIISNNNNHSKNKRTHTRGGLLCEWTDELTKDKCHNKYENCHCFRRRCGISPYKRQVIQKIIDHQIISILCILLFLLLLLLYSHNFIRCFSCVVYSFIPTLAWVFFLLVCLLTAYEVGKQQLTLQYVLHTLCRMLAICVSYNVS